MMDLNGVILRPYQVEAHEATAAAIRKYEGPFFLNMSVGAGKTLSIAAVCKRFNELGMTVLVLARQGELVEQDSNDCWLVGCANSVFSASLNRKSLRHPIVFGTEGTVARALESEMRSFTPNAILIDECHMVDASEDSSQYMAIINEMKRRNPKLIVIGYTGSPYRGTTSIVGDFWKKEVYRKDMDSLVGEGYLVPAIYGDHIEGYDLSEFKPEYSDGAAEFTREQMLSMQRKIHKELSKTQSIMHEVMELTRDRLGVLITCSGAKHCEEAASVLPEGSFGIVTDQTSTKTRRKILDDARTGRIKYVLQIGCLTTGVNVPYWDTNVILRRIGSLTLLTQLIGRTARLLKPEQIDSGMVKNDHLVLDYAGTFESLGELYFNPMLEYAELARATKTGELITCPECGTMNSSHARRCIGRDASSRDGRCSFFWISRDCPHCGEKNDIAARYCRSCDGILIDPNAKLTGKAYSADDWKPVTKMEIEPCKNGGIVVKYHTDSELDDGRPEIASMYFNPWSNNATAKRIYESQFVNRHINDWGWRKKFSALPNAQAVMKMRAMLDIPTHITHRLNDDGKSIVHGMKFATREVVGSKHKSVA